MDDERRPLVERTSPLSWGPTDTYEAEPKRRDSLPSSPINNDTARLKTVANSKLYVTQHQIYDSTSTVNSDGGYSLKRQHEDKRADHPTTDFQTFIHLVKGNIGTGALALPLAISKVGYILGPVLLVVLAVMCIHSMVLLVKSCQELCKRVNKTTLDYGEVVEATFWQFKFKYNCCGHVFNELVLGKIAKAIINILLVVTQFGFCCVYFIFWGINLQQIFEACGLELSTRIWMLIMLPIVIVFTWIRTLDALTPFSFIANIGLVFGIGSILFYLVDKMIEKEAAIFHDSGSSQNSTLHSVTLSMTGLPIFFGNVLFTFEAIGLILPVENKMKKPQHFNMVLYLSMTVVTAVYLMIGVLGYLTFGSNIEDSITLNLPRDKHPHSVVFHISKLLFCYAIFVTYMLCFYVPMDFLEPTLLRWLNIDKTKKVKKLTFHIVFRSTIVIITAGLALGIPKLDLFITLIGAFASSMLAIIFPPILEIAVFYKTPEPCWQKFFWVTKSLVILLVGLVGFSTGTFTSIQNIVQYIEGK